MPLAVNDIFDLPYRAAPIRVALEPARSAIQSLVMLTRAHRHVNISDWVVETREALTQAELTTNNLVMIGLYYVVLPMESWRSFPAYVDHLAGLPPEALSDKMLDMYEQLAREDAKGVIADAGELIDLATALTSADDYLAYLRQRFSPENVDETIEREAYRYVTDPPALQRLVVDHLRHMWDTYLAEEWERMLPTLQTIVKAYRRLDLQGKSFIEAGQLITGQDLDETRWANYFANARRIVFIPHPHVGPYLPKCYSNSKEGIVFFSARLPDWLDRDTPELTRAEIAIRLGALADDTRLRILRHIAENGEQRSSMIMEALDLSQSAASRHLTQLSTAGFLNERRCDGGKCYALNPERVTGTLQAIANFLLIQERNGS